MSRQFIDDDLINWEVFASTGRFSLPDDGKLVFVCLTDPDRRPRAIAFDAGAADTGAAVESLPDQRLRDLLERSRQLH